MKVPFEDHPTIQEEKETATLLKKGDEVKEEDPTKKPDVSESSENES